MHKAWKIIIGVFTSLPVLAMFLYFLIFFLMFFMEFPFSLEQLFDWYIAVFMVAPFLLVYYIVHVALNKMATPTERGLIIGALFVMCPIVMPLYWYFYIWKEMPFVLDGVFSSKGAAPQQTFEVRNFCPACGTKNDGSHNCRKCGVSLVSSVSVMAPVPITPQKSIVETLIPTKNQSSLAAYYLGLFSVVPFFPIGIAAMILGIKGLLFARRNPEAEGKTHSWVGILSGGFFGIVYLLVFLVFFAPDFGMNTRFADASKEWIYEHVGLSFIEDPPVARTDTKEKANPITGGEKIREKAPDASEGYPRPRDEFDIRTPLEQCAIGARLLQSGDVSAAVGYIEKAYSSSPIICAEELAIAYTKMQRYEDAVAVLERARDAAIEAGDSTAFGWYYYNLGFLYEISGNYTYAAGMYAKSLKEDGDDSRAKEALIRMEKLGY